MSKFSTRLYLAALAMIACSAVPAFAQFQPRTLNDPATGEAYHIEGSLNLWLPGADMAVQSSAFGIAGSRIDFKRDLGLQDSNVPDFQLVLRPATKHKFRLQYLSLGYDQSATLTREITFNGQLYRVGLPVNSQLTWKTTRLAYEYDFISKNRAFAGLILEAKYTDVEAGLQSPLLIEYARARAPIPALGGIFRYYVVPNISITGELSGVTVPSSLSPDYNAHYADFDIYGTLNVTNNVGAKIGYRSIDVGYVFEQDRGDFKVQGLYFGIVARY